MTLGTNVPTPAFTNVAIAPQFYAPSYFQITNVSQSPNAQVTVVSNFGRTLNFVVGQEVSFVIPSKYQMYQLDGLTGVVVTLVDANNFTVNIDTTAFTAFDPAPLNERQIAQVIPSGTYNTGNIIPNPQSIPLANLAIPGSYTNTQPNVGL